MMVMELSVEGRKRVREEVVNWLDGAFVDLEEARSALAGGRNNWAVVG